MILKCLSITLLFVASMAHGKVANQWISKIDSNPSQASLPANQAELALALYKEGMKELALNIFFSIPNPQYLSSKSRQNWLNVLANDIDLWLPITSSLNTNWKKWLPLWAQPNLWTSSKTLSRVAASAPTSKVKDEALYRRSLLWLKNKKTQYQALLELKKLVKSNIKKDRALIAVARAYYQMKNFDQSISFYNQIPRSSAYWPLSREELGWAYLMKNQPDKALAHLKTLDAKLFVSEMTPETYYVKNYINFKFCDYLEVFNTGKLFKAKYEPKAKFLKKLSRGTADPTVMEVRQSFMENGFKWSKISKMMEILPHHFQFDGFLTASLKLNIGSRIQRKKLESRFSKNGYPLSLLNQQLELIETLKSNSFRRLQILAQAELKEIQTYLPLLHIIEAETIQRIHGQAPKRLAQFKASNKNKSDLMTFPDSDEVWIDELDNYQVNMEGCIKKGSRR